MIRFAVIGTNTITDKFLQAASALPDFKLCAVYSRTLARAQEYAQKNNAVSYTHLTLPTKRIV